MQIFNVTPEKIVKPKYCACCHEVIDTTELVFYGHSNYRSLNNNCSVYICQQCAGERTGYIMECPCNEHL